MTRQGSAGLSLFELLIALALLAVIAAGLGASMRLGILGLDRSSGLSESSVELGHRVRLRLWLARATSPTLITGIPLRFEGGAKGFAFTTLAETPFAPSAAALRVEVSLQGSRLAFVAIKLDDRGDPGERFDGSLAEDIADLHFSYYDAQGEIPGWRLEWTDSTRLPALVRIEAAPGSRPDWPDFVVQLLLNG